MCRAGPTERPDERALCDEIDVRAVSCAPATACRKLLNTCGICRCTVTAPFVVTCILRASHPANVTVGVYAYSDDSTGIVHVTCSRTGNPIIKCDL